jgi:protein-tyrosine phosphatase
MGFTLAPGKHAAAEDGHTWQRDLDADLARIRQAYAIDVVVSLLEPQEQHSLGIRGYRRSAKRHGLELIKFPIPDGGVPEREGLLRLAHELSARIDRGSRIVVHCRGGLGRSGLVTAAVLVRRGVTPARAIEAVRLCRPGAIESREQERMLYKLTDPPAGHATALTRAKDWIAQLRLAPPQRIESFDVFPILASGNGCELHCLLGPEAIVNGRLSVAEMPGGAVVQRLQATSMEDAVLVLEGDTLIGCKQNRVVTRTVLVPPKSTVILEVGCMEHGRWSAVSRHFTFGGDRMEGQIRRQTVAERSRGKFDQQRLWAQVSARLETSGVASETSDYHSFVTSRASAIGARKRDLNAQPGQIGVLVLHANRLVALELLATPGLWKQVAERTLGALLLADKGVAAEAAAVDPERWMASVAERCLTLSPGLGLGSDIAVAGDGFDGSGLWLGESMAHLAVFGSN